ncbi:MAG: Alcohol dehydrogenase [Ktedonobacterales bacterium]|jgi:maleylacetate reductase|nr:MAG: Alcohol dehydrogenase [Ktedonobacterales bacterium]
MSAFRYTFYAQEVIFGPGSITKLREASERFGGHRIMLCTTAHARSRGHVTAVEDALGERLVASYESVRPHVQDTQVAEALTLAAEYQVDALIGLGGGSTIGMAKAVSFELAEQQSEPTARAATASGWPLIPIVAIPTTYAGSEMTPVFGVTRHVDGVAHKVTVTDARVTPRLTIYDPLLTLDLPPLMTASTGINAVAHCIEALYSITRNPLSSAAALGGLRAMAQALPCCYVAGDDLEARTEMLTGAFLAGTALANVAMGLHHGICHVLGGTAGVAHGDANGVMLPHVMRFNLDATAPQLAQAAEAMGIPLAGQSAEAAATAATQQIADWIRDMRLPQRLRDVGVREADLPALAQLAFASRTVQNNPKAIGDVAQMEKLLRQAW